MIGLRFHLFIGLIIFILIFNIVAQKIKIVKICFLYNIQIKFRCLNLFCICLEREKKTQKIRKIAKKKKRGNNTNFKILTNITCRKK